MNRRLVVLASGVAALVLLATPAFAHVTVNPSSAAKGGFAKLSFRVPNESDSASTTQVEVNFPTEEPLAFVSVKPVPGWNFAVEKTTLAKPISSDDGEVTQAVSKVTWTGGKIGPGEFQEFDVSLGPLPDDADSIVFKALQTYDNGDVVRWIDATPASGDEPEHPAPVLTLTDASGDDRHATEEPADDSATDDSATDDDVSQVRVLAITGIVLAVIAGLVALAGRRTRSDGS